MKRTRLIPDTKFHGPSKEADLATIINCINNMKRNLRRAEVLLNYVMKNEYDKPLSVKESREG